MAGTPALAPAQGDAVDEFGRAVALSGEVAVVLAEGHGAYVFEDDGGWSMTTVLTPEEQGNFGSHNVSAAMVGGEAILGGPDAGSEGGEIHLFERVDGQWQQRHQFVPDGERDEFGRSVAFDGDRVVVGDNNDPTPMRSWSGDAFVFARDGSNWTQEARLGTDAQDLFGTDVAVAGETVLVGAPYAGSETEETGAVYGYELRDDEWERRTTLAPDDSVDDSLFGHSVAFDGGTAVVGAPGRDGGSVYVFERFGDGWKRVARATAADAAPDDGFGESVDVAGEVAVVGAPDAGQAGQADVFRKDPDDGWVRTRRLVADEPREDAAFGFAVAMHGATVLVGSPVFREPSPAYLFDL
ncbi:MAG: FG-GAP repeat protein [Haloferacaceae archaeon]